MNLQYYNIIINHLNLNIPLDNKEIFIYYQYSTMLQKQRKFTKLDKCRSNDVAHVATLRVSITYFSARAGHPSLSQPQTVGTDVSPPCFK